MVEQEGLDTVTEQVLRYKLESAVNEMELTLLKSAYSPIVKESQDASSAIFDAQGRVQAQAVALPAHLEMMVPALETLIETFEIPNMSDGDIYMVNDPYSGGTHLPDITLAKPVFHEDEVVAFSACLMHHQDIGGKVPGSVPMDATELYEEGIIIPPMKLYDSGQERTDVLNLIAKNVRVGESFLGDINAQIGACKTGTRRLQDIVAELGIDDVLLGFDQLVSNAEALIRSDITEMPDGNYAFQDVIDGDGVNHDTIRLAVTVTIEGSEIDIDFEGSSEQVDGPLNCVPASSLSSVNFAVRAISTEDLPNNSGVTNPINVNLPQGSIVNPYPPAPVNARGVTIKRIVDTLFGAFVQAIPDRIPAAGGGEVRSLGWGGIDDNRDEWVYREVFVGGFGARPTKDGIDVIDTDVTNVMNTPVEAAELEAPLRVQSLELRTDSGGAGRYRGGLGCHKRIEVQSESTFSHRSDRKETPPWGVEGGHSGTTGDVMIYRDGAEVDDYPSKFVTNLENGDIIDMFTPGGGGHGEPTNRPPEEVLNDVREEKVSAEKARRQYGVVVADDGRIDEDATAERRQQ